MANLSSVKIDHYTDSTVVSDEQQHNVP